MSFLRKIFSSTTYDGLDDFLTNYVCHQGRGNVNELQKHIKKVSRKDIVNRVVQQHINSRQENALHKAALQGERELVECLLTAIPPPTRKLVLSAKDCDGNTALWLAASAGHTEIVECILKHCWDETNARYDMLAVTNNHGDTTLSCAASYGHGETVAFIMAAIPYYRRYQLLRIGNKAGDTALHKAAFNGQTEMVKRILYSLEDAAWLLVTRLLVVTNSYRGIMQPLTMAATSPYHQRYQLLQIGNEAGDTAQHRAAFYGRTEIIEYAIQCFKDKTRYDLLAATNNHGDTTLSCAASYGHEEMVAFIMSAIPYYQRYQLLQIGNKAGDTALHRAAFYGHTKTVMTLLKDVLQNQGLELLMKTNAAGETVVFAAAVAGCSNTIHSLLRVFGLSKEHKIPCSPNNESETAAYRAVSDGDQETLEALWGSPNTEELRENPTHFTDSVYILITSATNGLAVTVKYILDNMEPSRRSTLLLQQNANGQTLAHIAAGNGYTQVIVAMIESLTTSDKLLLISAPDCDSRTVIDCAAIKDQVACVGYILSTLDSNTKLTIATKRNVTGETILHQVASNGYSETLTAILCQVDHAHRRYLLSFADNDNRGPLLAALLNGHAETCQAALFTLGIAVRCELLENSYYGKETVFHWVAHCNQRQLLENIQMVCFYSLRSLITVLSAQNENGDTALSVAALSGNTTALLGMVNAVDCAHRYKLLRIKNSQGQTVMHQAVVNGHITTIRLLLALTPVEVKVLAGAKDSEGKTPADLLQKHLPLQGWMPERRKKQVSLHELFIWMLEKKEEPVNICGWIPEERQKLLNIFRCMLRKRHKSVSAFGWMPEIRQKPVIIPCTEFESIQHLPIFTAFSLSQEGKKEIDTSHSQTVGDAMIESSKENIPGENDIHQHQKPAAENEALPPQSMEDNSSIGDVVHSDSKYIYSTYDEVPIPDVSKDILPAAADTQDFKKSAINIKTQLTAQEETKDITQQKLLVVDTEQTSPLSTVGGHITEAADDDSSAAAAMRGDPHPQEQEHKRKEKAKVRADNQYIYSTYDEVPIPGVSKDILPEPAETHDIKIPTANIKSSLARGRETRYVIQRKLGKLTVKQSKLEKRQRKIAEESQSWKEKLKEYLENMDVGTHHEEHTREATVAQCQSKIEELELKQEVTNAKIHHLEKDVKDVRHELDELQTAKGAEQAVDEDDEVTDIDMLPDDIEIQAYGLGVQPDDPDDELYLSTSSLESDTTTTDLVPAVNIAQNIQPRLEDKIDNNLLAPSGACTEVDVTPEAAEHDSTLNDNKIENMEPRIEDTIQNILVPQTAVADPECNTSQTTHRHNTDVDALDRVSHLRTEYEVQMRKLKDECTRIADELQSVKQQQTTNTDMRDNSTLHDKIIELERKQQTTNVQLEEFAEMIREIETATKEAAPPQSEEGEIQECNKPQVHGGVSQQVHGGVSQQLLVVEPPPDEVDIDGHIEQQEHGPRATYIVSLWRKIEEESLWYC